MDDTMEKTASDSQEQVRGGRSWEAESLGAEV